MKNEGGREGMAGDLDQSAELMLAITGKEAVAQDSYEQRIREQLVRGCCCCVCMYY